MLSRKTRMVLKMVDRHRNLLYILISIKVKINSLMLVRVPITNRDERQLIRYVNKGQTLDQGHLP